MRVSIEVGNTLHQRCRFESAFEVVSPAMIGAREALCVALAFDEGHRAVKADPGVGAKSRLGIAHEQNGLAVKIEGSIVPDLGQLVVARDRVPAGATGYQIAEFTAGGPNNKYQQGRKRTAQQDDLQQQRQHTLRVGEVGADRCEKCPRAGTPAGGM